MDDGDIPALEARVVEVVQKADKDGEIDAGTFTMKVARVRIAKALDLEIEDLEEKKWKTMCKELVGQAIEDLSNQPSSSKPKAKAKDKSPTKPKSKPDPKPKSKPAKTPARPAPKSKSKGRSESPIEVLDSSQVQGDDEVQVVKSVAAKGKTNVGMKGKGKKKVVDPDEEEEEEEDVQVVDAGDGAEEDVAAKSESEMSSLIDEPLTTSKRKGRKAREEGDDERPKKKAKTSTTPKAKPRKKLDANDDPDEARVKELKAIVTACGVRKVWKKEFEDFPEAKDQIKYLQRLLNSLGMSGQLSLSKAKGIKMKRELAAEASDVAEYNAERGLASSSRHKDEEKSGERVIQTRRGKVVMKQQVSIPSESEGETEEEDEEGSVVEVGDDDSGDEGSMMEVDSGSEFEE